MYEVYNDARYLPIITGGVIFSSKEKNNRQMWEIWRIVQIIQNHRKNKYIYIYIYKNTYQFSLVKFITLYVL